MRSPAIREEGKSDRNDQTRGNQSSARGWGLPTGFFLSFFSGDFAFGLGKVSCSVVASVRNTSRVQGHGTTGICACIYSYPGRRLDNYRRFPAEEAALR